MVFVKRGQWRKSMMALGLEIYTLERIVVRTC